MLLTVICFQNSLVPAPSLPDPRIRPRRRARGSASPGATPPGTDSADTGGRGQERGH